MSLSPCGQLGPDEATALTYRDRARSVYGGASQDLATIPRLVHLELVGPTPSWIGALTHLRTLVCRAGTETLPAELADLPHLRALHLDGCALRSLAGLERLPALETLTFSGTPIARDAAALAAALEKLANATALDFLPGIEIARTTAPPPSDRALLLAALRHDTLPDRSRLRGVDLGGEAFDDLWVTHDFANARLANTVWRRCDFAGSFAGADLTGAVFEDCYFASNQRGNLANVRAPGARWIWCGGELQLRGADLRGAQLYLERDAGLELVDAIAENAVIVSTFCSEREHRWDARGAQLRGAAIDLDVAPRRRAEIRDARARVAWKQDHLEGAALDAAAVTYAPLDDASHG